jgi:hypothetical protein
MGLMPFPTTLIPEKALLHHHSNAIHLNLMLW